MNITEKEHRSSMEEAISIEGTLLMLDDATPHVAVPVQAMQDGKAVVTALSDGSGKYRFVNLKRGRYQVRCHVLDDYVYYGEGGSTVDDESRAVFLQIKPGLTRDNIDFRFAPFKKGTWRTYTTLDGLAHNAAGRIYRDPDGIMWFGTEGGGISRYDGKKFSNLTTKDGLAGKIVWAIHRDPDGIMWFGLTGGLSRYDGKEFRNFTTENGLPSNVVFAIHRDPDGIMWFGTEYGGVSRYDGKEFRNFTTEDGLVGDRVFVVHRDPDGVMWFGAREAGVSRYDGKEFQNLTTEDGLASNMVSVIHRDPDGVLWFGTEGGGISRYDGKEFRNLTTEDGLAHNVVHAIHRDPDGVMWFGTNGGASRYNGKSFVNFTREDGLGNNVVHEIYRDPDGVMWFATGSIGADARGGVSRYDEEGFVNFTARDGLANNSVHTMHSDPDDVLWFGTSGGLSLYDGEHFTNFTTADGLPGDRIIKINSDLDGVIWVSALWNGVSRYDGKEFTNFTVENGLLHNIVPAIYCDPDGTLWFGSVGGVFSYDGSKFTNLTSTESLRGNVWVIYREPNGVMWFGMWRGGLSRYDGTKFVNFTAKDGLVDSDIFDIYSAPDGLMWIATCGGVSLYDGKSFTNFTTEDGLSHNYVNVVYRDLGGRMWFGTDGGGVSCYDGNAWTSLDTRDGLAGNSVQSIHQAPDGSLWFATDGGVTRYRRSPVFPKVCIVSVTAGQTYYDPGAIPAFTVGTRITVEYDSIDLKTIPEKRQYRFRLREMDSDWRKPTRDTHFDLTFQQPGKYTFEVQAIDRDLNYSEPAIMNLTVQPDPVLVSMQAELNHLRQEVGQEYHFESIIGRSAGIRQVHALMERAIDSGLTVLITGETGTGKELVAKAIHYNSLRKSCPFLDRNCGAIPKDLLASDLFGHRKGAFTGANEDKKGLFESASGGTVLLDEIGEMPEEAQIHLLRVLQELRIQRLGEMQLRDVDVRVIATTNRDLAAEVEEGRFREDLYYRLNVFPIHIPPLRERTGDIPLLAEHFLEETCHQQNKGLSGFATGVLDILSSYPWPGNVRELEHEIYRAVALAEEYTKIQTYHFSSKVTRGESLIQKIASEGTDYVEAVNNFRRRFIEQVLTECAGNRHEAARRLGMDRSNLIKLIRRLGIGNDGAQNVKK